MKTTEQNNRMIAEFMGAVEVRENNFKFPNLVGLPLQIGTITYHTSWDWIMEVVGKIESLDVFPDTENAINVTIGATNYCVIQDSYGEIIEIIGAESSKLLSTYQAVCQFIEWYNEIHSHGKEENF